MRILEMNWKTCKNECIVPFSEVQAYSWSANEQGCPPDVSRYRDGLFLFQLGTVATYSSLWELNVKLGKWVSLIFSEWWDQEKLHLIES